MTEKFIHPTAIVDDGARIGTGTHVWHFCHIMPGAVIGNNCTIGQNVFVDNNAVIGNGVKIQNNVSIYNSVVLEDEVFVGPSVVFTNVLNPRSFIERKLEFKPTIIKKGATLGANSTIVCGTTIGAYALIGAGSVIINDVMPYALIVGNPGIQKGWVSEAGNTLHFNEENIAVCKYTQEKYLLSNNQLQKL